MCQKSLMRSKYDMTPVTRCKPCATSLRNSEMAKPNGSIRTHKQSGYIEEKSEGEWRRQHVLIMERSIGRRVREDEAVHHINEIKTDNRLENLELMGFGDHTRLHNMGKKYSEQRIKNARDGVRSGPTAKLNMESVKWIRERVSAGGLTQLQMAEMLSVSPMTVSRVVNNQTWRI